jgi:hypothetical protein
MAGSRAEVPAGAVAAGGTAPGGGLGRHPSFLYLGAASRHRCRAGLSFYGVGSRTLLETRIPVDLRSRAIGGSRVFTVSLVALVGIIGGDIGTTIGLRPTMEVGAAGMILALSPPSGGSTRQPRAVESEEVTAVYDIPLATRTPRAELVVAIPRASSTPHT